MVLLLADDLAAVPLLPDDGLLARSPAPPHVHLASDLPPPHRPWPPLRLDAPMVHLRPQHELSLLSTGARLLYR